MGAGCQGKQPCDWSVGALSPTPQTSSWQEGLRLNLWPVASDLINHALVMKPPVKTENGAQKASRLVKRRESGAPGEGVEASCPFPHLALGSSSVWILSMK